MRNHEMAPHTDRSMR